MDGETLSELFEETPHFSSSADDIFSLVEAWENSSYYNNNNLPTNSDPPLDAQSLAFRNSSACKRQKLMTNSSASASSHITVERNRRKQMNDHLSVLRSLMPCFYVKRGDQASIIGGVVDYINELQQVLQSLEAKKQRKAAAYSEVMSPRTPQPSSPYSRPWMHPSGFLNSPSLPPSPCNSSTSSSVNDAINDLVATSKSPLAEVEVKFSGPNLLLKTVSHRLPGQVLKIVSTLEQLALQILHLSISTVDEKMLNSFTIKIGIQCQLSAEDLAEQIQQTFC